MRKIDGYQTNLLVLAKKLAIEGIRFSQFLPKNPAGYTLSSQLVRSATSVGANLTEAQNAISAKDFAYKLNHALKEAKESLYWMEVITESKLTSQDTEAFLQLNQEIVRILVASVHKLRDKVKAGSNF